MFNRKTQNNTAENGDFWISISDLMSSLLFVFVLVLSYVILDYQKKNDLTTKTVKLFQDNLNIRNELLKQLEISLKEKNIAIEVDYEQGILRIIEKNLFKSARFNISKDKLWVIQEVTNNILSRLKQQKFLNAINTVFIEGHTDNIPLRSNMKIFGANWTNVELSAMRAINTYFLMNKMSNKVLEKMKNIEGKALFSYSGYAASRPIKGTDNTLKKDRQRNRRLQFFFSINTPKIAI